uniref:Uncharacterized protein n=1 Tax=Chromera velia CCMP2878 TaxID=1169474 RepID=A0A0G4HGT1_9ALVE|eukprot:Cvel_6772.t1-p1 / transcript=Cvel_6772.t1 / gene=Cvel_6772 / organism=Chromera_velia_CCMP2878 / gene_product=hypothetical protein / transcript_product=hypothetical protein / location=Cvel_scaffold340:12137-13363(+) / protein_length=186 / sequence_SO=supercontig / SO=protein_coding / is_pseudo=false
MSCKSRDRRNSDNALQGGDEDLDFGAEVEPDVVDWESVLEVYLNLEPFDQVRSFTLSIRPHRTVEFPRFRCIPRFTRMQESTPNVTYGNHSLFGQGDLLEYSSLFKLPNVTVYAPLDDFEGTNYTLGLEGNLEEEPTLAEKWNQDDSKWNYTHVVESGKKLKLVDSVKSYRRKGEMGAAFDRMLKR